MTDPFARRTWPRPAPGTDPGPLDDRLYDLVEARFRRVVADDPVAATFYGLHDLDDSLGDGSRDAVLGRLAAERAHHSAVEALDPEGLSPEAAFERDLELHNVRRSVFELDQVRLWERRSVALDTIGEGLFLLFARDFAPLAERLSELAGRLDAVPTYLQQSRTRAAVPQVRLWQRLEIEAAQHLPEFIEEIVTTGRGELAATDLRRLERAAGRARDAIADHAGWLTGTLASGTDDWALGRERFDMLIGLRAFEDLDADAILAIGEAQLVEQSEARRAAAHDVDPAADEATVIDRIKSDHAATFGEALEAYRESMDRARAHVIARDLASVPDDERIHVLATPKYLRTLVPFAAYFQPARFEAMPAGLYIVTPSVGDGPGAMREHNRSSISNTSVHEAYPGHHLQLAVGSRHPSLTRLQADAPEFVEGWGMYCEQMMREEGFDDGPTFRVALATDAIWRACRIILDVRMSRGEIGVDEATEFLIRHTSFERANARAEVLRYTYTPTYQLSYLLGKVLLLRFREDERRRLGERFSLRHFHDGLLRNGSIPISFHRRLAAAGTTSNLEG